MNTQNQCERKEPGEPAWKQKLYYSDLVCKGLKGESGNNWQTGMYWPFSVTWPIVCLGRLAIGNISKYSNNRQTISLTACRTWTKDHDWKEWISLLDAFYKHHTTLYTTRFIYWTKQVIKLNVFIPLDSFSMQFQVSSHSKFLHSNSHHISPEWVHFHQNKLAIRLKHHAILRCFAYSLEDKSLHF